MGTSFSPALCLCAEVVLPCNDSVWGREDKDIASIGHGDAQLGLTSSSQFFCVGKGTLWSLGGTVGSPEIGCGNGMTCAW